LVYYDCLGQDPFYPSFYSLREGYDLHGRFGRLGLYSTRTLSLIVIFTRFDYIIIF
jgi:hypothetical protein